jgi:hemoglobin-like flavoprotein
MALDLNSLETSFDAIAPRGEELVEDFYNRLFTAAPPLRGLFPDDMTRQRTMLLAALVLLRKSLRDLDRIAPTLRSLGARHVGYGALPEHYPVVGTLLIESMAHVARRRLASGVRDRVGRCLCSGGGRDDGRGRAGDCAGVRRAPGRVTRSHLGRFGRSVSRV